MGIYDRNYYRDEPPAFQPWDRYSMVTNLIIVNVALLLLNFIFTNPNNALTELLVLRSSDLLQPWNWYRFLTYGFVHADLFHLLFNMLTLYFLGQSVESRYGRWEFLRISLVIIALCGGGFCLVRVIAPALGGGSVLGASGAVVGVVMLFVYNFPQATLMMWGVLPVKAWVLGIITVAVNLLGTQRHVAYDVHLLGILCATGYFYGGINLEVLAGGWSSLRGAFKRKPKLRVHKAEEEVPSRDEAEADRLLEKIHREGQSSLTANEQKFLEQYSRRVREKRTRS
ncbi:MAG: rhomboid family intramembrane serine protease [Pirellulaceae bacterium]|nr:rhomboid family intramembrane serine protease [Pirellulaceae bacterium]